MIVLLLIPLAALLWMLVRRRAHKRRVKATSWGMSDALDLAQAIERRERWAPRAHRKHGLWP